MPVGDLNGWRQVFADDFTTDVPLGRFPAAVSDRWWAYTDGWPDSTRRGVYAPSRVVRIAGGVMNLHLHSENGVPLVAAPVPRVAGAPSNNGQRYGRYSVRFRSDPVPGYKTAWLLWPDSERWPAEGEIDFPEGGLAGRMCGFVHHRDATRWSDQDAMCAAATYPDWHTATVEWAPGSVTFELDGAVVGRSSTRIPSTSLHWVLQTETATNGAPPPDPTAEGNVQIDWVTIYARASPAPPA